jgi:hypothetical protein
MKLIIPVESMIQKKGGVILYDPHANKILKQYVHDKKWKYDRVGWRGGIVYGDYLIATDWTDLHYFNIKEWKYVKTFKKNTFNDLHYVEVADDKLYVVNTGLDAIEIFKNPMDPQFKNIIFLFDKSKIFKKRNIDLNGDYNQKFKVKPHSAHPNCIAIENGKMVVNCFAKEQRINTGEVIRLSDGHKMVRRSYDCHDGIFYKGDYYLTRTRHSTILKFNKLMTRKLPAKNPDKVIKIGGRGWWRGMVIHNDTAYVFASDGYKKQKRTARIRIVKLNEKSKRGHRLPVVDGIHWDTIYQPNLWEE